MTYDIVVGLEVHVQLLTNSKLFSSSTNRFNPDAPNSQTDPVVLALPGALPVMNRKAFLLALKTALAMNCEIARFTKWDRKQYFYPDLPKGYQISQYDLPFSSDGWLEIPEAEDSEEVKRVRLNRIHLEEDAGKNLHDESGGKGSSLVDLNRAGTPLLEIVSEPDISSSFQAKSYLEELKLLLVYLGVSDCNMQEGSLRCDANVNLHVHTEDGGKVATPIVEIKNMNSFRNVEAAIDYEAKRQFKEWKKTGRKLGDPGVTKQTWGWNADKGETFLQRSKEEAADYRYFPDPDLVPVTVDDALLDSIRGEIVELPQARRSRYRKELGLSDYDSATLVEQGLAVATYFEQAAEVCGDAKQAANWVLQDVLRELNERKVELEDFPVTGEILGTIIKQVLDGRITNNSAKQVYASLLGQADEGEISIASVDEIIATENLEIVRDDGTLKAAIDTVLARNEKIVADVRGGKEQAVGPLIGQVMKHVKADPKKVRETILEQIRDMN